MYILLGGSYKKKNDTQNLIQTASRGKHGLKLRRKEKKCRFRMYCCL